MIVCSIISRRKQVAMTTGYVYDPIFIKHNWPNHPENAKRLAAIVNFMPRSRRFSLV
jgi:hypothetical protein